MGDDPDVGVLRLLDAAVRTGSISAAARECGVTQQTASARLSGLEQRLGLELLLRSPRGVVPTAAGETVASWAEDVLTAVDRYRFGIGMLRGERRRALSVAASQTVAAYLLPRWLVALRETQLAQGAAPPEVQMRAGNSEAVEALVRDGDVDLGFIESTAIPPGFGSTTVGMDALAVVVAPGHPWARVAVGQTASGEAASGQAASVSTASVSTASVSTAEVAGTPLVAREEGSGSRRTWEDAARRRGAEPVAPLVVLSTSTSVRSAVAEGLGPAVLARRAVADDISLGRLVEVPLTEGPVVRPITALWRGGARDLSALGRDLLECAVSDLGAGERRAPEWAAPLSRSSR